MVRSTTATTTNLWLASYFLREGLPFVRATRLPGRVFRAEFVLEDPDGRAPLLAARFRGDVGVQRFIDARRALAAALDHVAQQGACEPSDIENLLALLVEIPETND